jgi:peptidoglycan/xylan/chitin deacetylase (PgdA/CDA1 family)
LNGWFNDWSFVEQDSREGFSMPFVSRRAAKFFFYRALWLAGVHRVYLRRLRKNRPTIVLNLHRVSPAPNPFYPPLHPHDFESLLRFAKRHFEVTDFRTLAAVSCGARRNSHDRPFLVLSFDDGYYDFLEYAAPLLRKHGLTANQNVIGACVSSGEPPWNIVLYDFLNQSPRHLIDEIRLPGLTARLAGDGADAKLKYSLALIRVLKAKPAAERADLWAFIRRVMDKGNFETTRMMTADGVRQAAGEFEIGSHSFSHESMGLESQDFFAADFGRTKTFFVETLGLPMDVYAFPNGSFTPAQIDYLLGQGIGRVLLVEEKYNQAATGPVYARLTMSAESSEEACFQACCFKARGVY